jgi:hypothetical protein
LETDLQEMLMSTPDETKEKHPEPFADLSVLEVRELANKAAPGRFTRCCGMEITGAQCECWLEAQEMQEAGASCAPGGDMYCTVCGASIHDKRECSSRVCVELFFPS